MWTNTRRTYYGWSKFYIILPLSQICAQEHSKGWYFQCKVVSRTVGCCTSVAADIDWDSKYRINKSLYARRVSFLYKVPQHLFYYFHNSFSSIRDVFFYKYHNVDFIHIHQHFLHLNVILKCCTCIHSIYAFERFTFITQKQIVSKHRINLSIVRLYYIFMKYFDRFLFQFYRFLQVYNISYMIGIIFIFIQCPL